jgi:hypothetical protein
MARMRGPAGRRREEVHALVNLNGYSPGYCVISALAREEPLVSRGR